MQAEEPTSPTTPLATFPPLPEEYRSRAPEFYGFVAWTSTYLLFGLFILWAFLPDSFIIWLGITWYPNREWALLLPAYSMVLVWLTYFTYFGLAIRGTPSFSEISAITDSKAYVPDTSLGPHPYYPHARHGAIPELYDIPISLVNRVLYHSRSLVDPVITDDQGTSTL